VAVESQDDIKSEEVLHPSDGLRKKGDHRLPLSTTPAVGNKLLGADDYSMNPELTLDSSNKDLSGEDEDAEGEPDDEYLGLGTV
jgi:hypothetical protein